MNNPKVFESYYLNDNDDDGDADMQSVNDIQHIGNIDDNDDDDDDDDDDDVIITAAHIDECWRQLSILLLQIVNNDSHPLCSAYKNLLRDAPCQYNGQFSPWKNELHMMLYLLLCSQKFAVNISKELIKFLIIMFKTLKKMVGLKMHTIHKFQIHLMKSKSIKNHYLKWISRS